MVFKRLTDRNPVELAQYLKQYIEQVGEENVRLYIGCDSQNKSEWTNYATTVVLHIGTTGCHVLYQRERVRPRINDFWTREISIITSYYCGPPDLSEALELIASGKIEVDDLITHTLPLHDIKKGFRLVMDAEESIKVIIRPNE